MQFLHWIACFGPLVRSRSRSLHDARPAFLRALLLFLSSPSFLLFRCLFVSRFLSSRADFFSMAAWVEADFLYFSLFLHWAFRLPRRFRLRVGLPDYRPPARVLLIGRTGRTHRSDAPAPAKEWAVTVYLATSRTLAGRRTFCWRVAD